MNHKTEQDFIWDHGRIFPNTTSIYQIGQSPAGQNWKGILYELKCSETYDYNRLILLLHVTWQNKVELLVSAC